MGIAHRDAGKAEHVAVDVELGIKRDAPVGCLGAPEGRRHLERLEYGRTHVDSGRLELAGCIEREADGLGAGERVGNEATVRRIDDAAVDEELREAAHAIAAHLRLRAIRVVIIHVGGAFGTR